LNDGPTGVRLLFQLLDMWVEKGDNEPSLEACREDVLARAPKTIDPHELGAVGSASNVLRRK
jgi:hypothetical protein